MPKLFGISWGNSAQMGGFEAAGDSGKGGEVAFRDGTKVKVPTALRSSNAAANKAARRNVAAEAQHLALNDPLVAGAITNIANALSTVCLNSMPDWEMAEGGSADWASDTAKTLEKHWSHLLKLGLDAKTGSLEGLVSDIVRSWYTYGEVAALVDRNPSVAGKAKTRAVVINPTRIKSPSDQTDRIIVDGVEYSDRTSAVVALWIANTPAGASVEERTGKDDKPTRYPLLDRFGNTQVVFVANKQGPEQARGVSPLASIVNSAELLTNYTRAVQEWAVQQCNVTSIITADAATEDAAKEIVNGPTETADRFEIYGQQRMPVRGLSGKATSNTLFLAPGDSYQETQGQQADQVDSLHAALIAQLAAPFRMGHDSFLNDYSKTNFSSSRMSQRQHQRFLQSLSRQILEPVLNAAFRSMAFELSFSQPLLADGMTFQNDLLAVCNAHWALQAPIEADQAKAQRALADGLANGTITYADVASERGEHWTELLDQRAAEEAYLREKGLPLPGVQRIESDDLDLENKE